MADIIKATRGLKIDFEKVPLLLGEPGLATDEERLYIGGNNGNIPLPNATDLSDIANQFVTTPTANKILKLNLQGKLPASITGDADSIDGIQGNQIPLKTTTNLIYYVNTNTGLDTNDGLTSGTAVKTINKAISMIPQVVNHNIIINVASGTYNESVIIKGFVGYGAIALYGDSVVSNTRIINSLNVLSCICIINIQGFSTITTTTNDIAVGECTRATISYMNLINANTNVGIYVDYSSTYLHHCVISNKNVGIQSSVNANILAQVISGTGNTIALNAIYNGTIGKDTNTITGTTQELSASGGVIR